MSSVDAVPLRVVPDVLSFAYGTGRRPVATVSPGARLTVVTRDARDGAHADRPAGEAFDLPARTTPANGLTGPIAVAGADVGDALVVDVEAIRPVGAAWAAAAPGIGPLAPGRIARARARSVPPGPRVLLGALDVGPAAPMIGCIGTAPPAPVRSDLAGAFGGNLDHPTLGPGARLWLPVAHPGGLLFLGDVHAAQGDGELSGWGLETAAEVDLRLDLRAGEAPAWPWLETPGRLAVLAAAPTFPEARAAAVEALVDALEGQLGLQPAEALALLSLVGDLRLGGAYGAEVTTVRLEVRAALGLRPHPNPHRDRESQPCPT